MDHSRLKLNSASEKLLRQVEKIQLHSNFGSKKTRLNYVQKIRPFVQFVGTKFGLEDLANLSDKHLLAYVEHAKVNRYSVSTVKATFSAVRWFHGQLSKSKNRISDNSKLLEGFRCVKRG